MPTDNFNFKWSAFPHCFTCFTRRGRNCKGMFLFYTCYTWCGSLSFRINKITLISALFVLSLLFTNKRKHFSRTPPIRQVFVSLCSVKSSFNPVHTIFWQRPYCYVLVNKSYQPIHTENIFRNSVANAS